MSGEAYLQRRPWYVRLAQGKPLRRTTFQVAADVQVPPGLSPDAHILVALRVIYAWVNDRFRECPSIEEFYGSDTLECDFETHRLDAVRVPEIGVWSFKFFHTDNRVAGRTWSTDISIHVSGDSSRIAVRTYCTSMPGSNEPVAYTRPLVVESLALSVGLKEARPLDGNPWLIHSEGELNDLEALLTDPERSLPVILLTRQAGRDPGEEIEYTLDPRVLARDTLCLAHVVAVPPHINNAWTERVGKDWSAFGGAVRTYLPGLDFGQSPYAHRLATARSIFDIGVDAFHSFIVRKMFELSAAKPLRMEGCRFLVEAKSYRAEQSGATSVDERGRIEAYEEQVALLKQQLKDKDEEIEELFGIALEYETRADTAESQRQVDIAQLKEEIEDLKRQLYGFQAKSVEKPGAEGEGGIDWMDLPESYKDVPGWVDEYLRDRLVLHPRAIRSLKEAEYEDLGLVCLALGLLAYEYRNTKLAGEDRSDDAYEVWEEKLRSLGLQCSQAILKLRAGEQKDAYRFEYPPGSGRFREIERHLFKGKDHDRRYCLRVYFFWDGDTEQVVVGWLPSHLPTRTS